MEVNQACEMAPPPPMNCSAPGCEFVTPAAIPTYEYVIKALEIHVQSANTGSSRALTPKTEKPKRPALTTNMSESDCFFSSTSGKDTNVFHKLMVSCLLMSFGRA